VIRLFISIFTLVFMFAGVSTSHAQSFTEAQKAEINKMFEEYISNNGKVIIEGVSKYQQEQEEAAYKDQDAKAKSFMEELKGKKNLPMAGNPKGDVTVVEFFDYNCGYCRKALSEVKKVIKDDKNVRVVFIDMPILGPSSLEVSKWSLAANMQGKYFEFHQAVMNKNGEKNESVLSAIAKDLGLDVAKMKTDKESEAVNLELQANLATAQDLGIRGTPGFIVGEQVVRGYVPSDQIKSIVATTRNK